MSHETDQAFLEERWRPVYGYETTHEVSSMGRVARLPGPRVRRRRILKPYLHVTGYYTMWLSVAGKVRRNRKVHILVCEAFHGPRPDHMCVRHLDGNRTNNDPTNLAWGTWSENNLDAVRHGTHHESGPNCKRGHPLSGENLYVTPSTGQRRCRTCQKAIRPLPKYRIAEGAR